MTLEQPISGLPILSERETDLSDLAGITAGDRQGQAWVWKKSRGDDGTPSGWNDDERMERLAVVSARLYLDAYERWERGEATTVELMTPDGGAHALVWREGAPATHAAVSASPGVLDHAKPGSLDLGSHRLRRAQAELRLARGPGSTTCKS